MKNGSLPGRFGALMLALEGRVLLSTYVVTNVNDAGAGSLRQAILDANVDSALDTINFSIGSGVKTIAPLTVLPDITTPVILDGTSQPGYTGTPLIELSGSSVPTPVDGLTLTGGNSTLKGLAINNWKASGVTIKDGGNNIVQNMYIGTDPTGMIQRGNAYHGMIVLGDYNTFGGTLASQRNIFSGNGIIGLFLLYSNHDTVQGNYIGVGADGTTAIPNGLGLSMQEADDTQIGGTAAGAGNVISGNNGDGLLVYAGSDHNTIQGNLIGTDLSGTKAVANTNWGIELQGAHNLVGGTAAGARNIISGNGLDGLVFYLINSQFNVVAGNYIGTDITGTKFLSNRYAGVSFSGDTDVHLTAPGPVNNILGGTTPAERNIIAGNGGPGVGIYNRTSGNFITGNYIGTDVTGINAMPNRSGFEIYDTSTYNTIGGTAPGAGNLIAGNFSAGAYIGSDYTTVQGNVFGFNANGGALANGAEGIVTVNSSHNTIGGALPAARNTISNSKTAGIKLDGGGSNVVQGNFIGTDASGTGAAGNLQFGVQVQNSSGNTIASNVIANNGYQGVYISAGTGNRITANSIYANVGGGIDLGSVGPNANDSLDPDTGPNNLQNFPVLATAVTDGATTSVSGTINSIANATLTMEFFATPTAYSNGYGPGKVYLGSLTVTTNASGNASFSGSFDVASSPGQVVAGTATAGDGSTSEFSLARTLTAAPAPALAGSSFAYQSGPARLAFTFTQNVSGSAGVGDVLIQTLPSGPTFSPASVTYDPATRTVGFVLPAGFPNGNYRATLNAAGISNANGTGMTGGLATLDFWVLNGDANRDRHVDFSDLVVLAQNYDLPGGGSYSAGDFTGDGLVNFSDLVILAQNYDAALAAAPLPAPAPVMAIAIATPMLAPVKSAAAIKPAPKPVSKPKAAVRPVVAPPKPAFGTARIKRPRTDLLK